MPPAVLLVPVILLYIRFFSVHGSVLSLASNASSNYSSVSTKCPEGNMLAKYSIYFYILIPYFQSCILVLFTIYSIYNVI